MSDDLDPPVPPELEQWVLRTVKEQTGDEPSVWARYVEGLLDPAETARIEALASQHPAIAERIAKLEAALPDRVELREVAVPPALEEWVRAAVPDHARPIVSARVHDGPALAQPHSWRPWAAAAAALLVGIGLGGFLRAEPAPAPRVADAPPEPSDDPLAVARRDAERTRDQLKAAKRDAQRASERFEAAKRDADQNRESLAKTQRELQALTTRVGSLAEELEQRDSETLRQRNRARAQDDDLEALRDELRGVRREMADARESARLTQAALAKARSLSPGSPAPPQIDDATGVERWDTGSRVWRPLTVGARLPAGTVLRTTAPRGTVRVDQTERHLGPGLYVVDARGVQPIPARRRGNGAHHAPVPPPAIPAAERPGLGRRLLARFGR